MIIHKMMWPNLMIKKKEEEETNTSYKIKWFPFCVHIELFLECDLSKSHKHMVNSLMWYFFMD